MGKRTHQCPHCKDWFRDVNGHIARMHPEQATPKKSHHKKPEKPQPKTAGKKLELKSPFEKKLEEVGLKLGYHCVDCGGPLTKGQTPCPGCGVALDWRGL